MPSSIRVSPHPNETKNAPLQPVLGTNKLAAVPSLRALEQPGGPEVDGPLILPDPVPWSSRLNELAESLS